MAKDENLEKLEIVAHSLNPFLSSKQNVFIGGAVVSLLITDKTVEFRSTIDVDIVIATKTLVEYHKIESSLREKGFTQVPDDIICRWDINGVLVDLMPTDENVLGFSNRWYPAAIKHSKEYKIDNNIKINLISIPCFLATKMEAFKGRGKKDFMDSHDIEDIVNVVNGYENLASLVDSVSLKTMRKFIIQKFRSYLKEDLFHESIKSTLLPDPISQDRYYIIEKRIREVAELEF